MTLSANSQRVLDAIRNASPEWDGWAPHGAADWTGVVRLLAANLIMNVGMGVCYDCDTEAHRREPTEVPLFRLVEAGGAS